MAEAKTQNDKIIKLFMVLFFKYGKVRHLSVKGGGGGREWALFGTTTFVP